MLEEILRNVVRGVAATNDDGFFARAGGCRAIEFRGVNEAGAAEVGKTCDVGGEVGFAAGAGGLDDVARVEYAYWLLVECS